MCSAYSGVLLCSVVCCVMCELAIKSYIYTHAHSHGPRKTILVNDCDRPPSSPRSC